MNPNVNTLFEDAVIGAMQAERLMTPEQQADRIIEALGLRLRGTVALVELLCSDMSVDDIAEEIVARLVQGQNRLRAWEALGYQTRYAGEGNNLLMSGEAAVETVYVG